jgi:hypothetical protein
MDRYSISPPDSSTLCLFCVTLLNVGPPEHYWKPRVEISTDEEGMMTVKITSKEEHEDGHFITKMEIK